MGKIIIGFCGYAGVGKDTAANAIGEYCERQLGKPGRFAFADPMRDMLLALGVPAEYMVDRNLKEQPIPGLGRSYRQLAQTLGTEWGRVCHGEDFWVRALAARVDKFDGDVVLIPDVRFPNEAKWIRSQGGYLARITRPAWAAVNPHESERHVAEMSAEFEMLNTGSKEDLEEAAVGVLQQVVRARVMARNKRQK